MLGKYDFPCLVSLHPETKIGHVHLTVSNLERSLYFYRDLLGFTVTQWSGQSAVFLAAGNYHHHLGLNTWAGEGAKPPPPGSTGLYHLAILYPNRVELAKTVKNLLEASYPLEGTADHGVSEAIYLSDPDGNGVELYADRPQNDWPRDEKGNLQMITQPLDLTNLLTGLRRTDSKPG